MLPDYIKASGSSFQKRRPCFNPSQPTHVLIKTSWKKRKLYLQLLPLNLSFAPSFQHYSSSHSVTVHMVLQHCWSPVATLPTMHLWIWALDEADRLRVLWYRPAIAWCEVSSVQCWSVSEQHTPITFSPSWILTINPQFSALTFAFTEVKVVLYSFL